MAGTSRLVAAAQRVTAPAQRFGVDDKSIFETIGKSKNGFSPIS
jgi:hypothetical protein